MHTTFETLAGLLAEVLVIILILGDFNEILGVCNTDCALRIRDGRIGAGLKGGAKLAILEVCKDHLS